MERIFDAIQSGGVMGEKLVDLREMTVEDLFSAKNLRRQRLARLPFEQKIEIVRRLQSVSHGALAGRSERLDESRKRQNTR
jgi:hypothetical protein